MISMDELLESSVWRRKSLMGGDKTHFDEQVQKDLHEATLKEVELGHLHGPFSEAQVSEHSAQTGGYSTLALLYFRGPRIRSGPLTMARGRL